MVSPLLIESYLNTRQVHSARLHSALQCMHSNDFLGAILNNVSNDGQHQITNGYRHVKGRTGPGLNTWILPMPLSFGKTLTCSWHISQNTCDISHRESGTNSGKGTKVPCKEHAKTPSGPPFSALQRNTRGEGAGETSAPPRCTSREKRFVRAQSLYRISSSQDRQKTNVDFYSDLKNSTAWPLPWALW